MLCHTSAKMEHSEDVGSTAWPCTKSEIFNIIPSTCQSKLLHLRCCWWIQGRNHCISRLRMMISFSEIVERKKFNVRSLKICG